MWTYQFNYNFSVALLTFQVFNSHMYLVVTIQDDVEIQHCHHHRKFYLTVLVKKLFDSTGEFLA